MALIDEHFENYINNIALQEVERCGDCDIRALKCAYEALRLVARLSEFYPFMWGRSGVILSQHMSVTVATQST